MSYMKGRTHKIFINKEVFIKEDRKCQYSEIQQNVVQMTKQNTDGGEERSAQSHAH